MTEINRMGVAYRQLPNGTLVCGPLDQSAKVGGTNEQERNAVHNPERLQRIRDFYPNPKVLDYGCGSGLLVRYLRKNGIDALGYDKYASSSDSILGYQDKHPVDLDVITMIEVVEHLDDPYIEFDAAFEMLKPGGVLMIETSFSDWMGPDYNDPYINPAIGHSTIFSHAGLDEVMLSKGFEVYGHINRNVRCYQKPEPKEGPKISLITMGQANPVALKRTMDSFKDVVDEIVFGDFLIFESDRAIIQSYKADYNLKIVRAPFNFIFEEGFSETLNMLATHAKNDWILYMNVSEVLDGDHPIGEQMSNLYNCYSFDHHEETHRWFRLYNKKEVKWGGLIHEEVIPIDSSGYLRPCPFNVFRMKDTLKDGDDPLKEKASNDVKEMVYWNQLVKLVDNPELRANTHPNWIEYAKEQYDYNNERMKMKGKRYEAMKKGDLQMYLDDIYHNPDFEKERFLSSKNINFQGDGLLLG